MIESGSTCYWPLLCVGVHRLSDEVSAILLYNVQMYMCACTHVRLRARAQVKGSRDDGCIILCHTSP